MKKKDILVLAIGIAVFPPIWAVLSGHVGVTVGPVALICAGIYVASKGTPAIGLRQSVSYIASIIWTLAAMKLLEILPFGADINLYVTLFVLGGVAVLIACNLDKVFDLPAWLGGWAIGLTVIAPKGISGMGTLPIQVLVAMLVGVWYVGYGVSVFQRLFSKEKK